MGIRDIEFLALRSELPQPAHFSWGSATARNVGLLRVTTDDGVTGVGETSVTFPLWSLEERAYTVREGLRPLVLGRDPADIDGLVAHLEGTLGRLAPLWSPVAISASIGAFEVALWDIKGKVAGKPVFRLLNAAANPAPVPLYAVGFGGGPEEMARQAAAALDAGFKAVKIRAGFGRERDLALLDAMQATISDMDRVLVDANMAWSREQASELVPLVASFGVGWIEEPVVHDDVEALAALRQTCEVPIAAGENAYGLRAGLRLVEADAVDAIMPDIARCGGIRTARAMIAAARAKGLAYSPHHYASDVGFVASLHLCAAEPGVHSLLRDTSPWPLRSEVLTQPVRIESGLAWIPDGPGLGVEINEAAIGRYRIE